MSERENIHFKISKQEFKIQFTKNHLINQNVI